ncbi:uncharacterized protein METZ01_LOCUS456792 [marine metagenome]|uniref:Uncharacterized protein n=1 Tax=marine metagenome TaxID=408172 RepID=A0A383AA28_9ZZZZ
MLVSEERKVSPPNYRWPFIVGGFVVLWMLLAVVWMMWGANQTRKEGERRRHLDSFGNQLNQPNRVDDYE